MLLVLTAIPGILLWGMYRWSSGTVLAARSAAPPDDTNQLEGQTPPPALNTGLMSMRRTAPSLSVALNSAQFKNQLAPLEAMINETSCLDIQINGRPVGQINPDQPAIPASNQKLLVAAVADEVLGDEFTYKTDVVGPEPIDGTILGDVFLVGGGDPLLAGDWYKDANYDGHPEFNITSLDELADRLIASGVSQIDGSIVGDATRYDDEYFVADWGDGVAGVDGGPYDALMANDARVFGNDAKVADPAEGAAREFTRILTEKGVTVSGKARAGTAGDQFGSLASIESVPLPEVIKELLTNSDNDTSEMLVKEIGYVSNGQGTRQAGLDAMRKTMEGWGIDVTGLVLSDGSGLSPQNRVTCAQIVGILERFGPDSALGQGLAIAGATGTLATVFRGTELQDRLMGKTGTLYNPPTDQDPPATKALSGFLEADGDKITYSMILNGPTIAEQQEYVPIWAEFATAMASYPAVANSDALAPR